MRPSSTIATTKSRRLANEYADLFGRNNFFLELQDHGLDQDKIVMPEVNRLARETGLPLVVTNDAHYLRHDDVRAHEILLCIQTGKTMSDPNRMRFSTPDFFIKSRAEMMQRFGEVEHALDITWDIAQRCQVKLEKVKDPFPDFAVPADHTADTYFAWVARQGFEKRRARLEALAAQGRLKHALPDYAERLEFEIAMIQQMKFSGYFLIVWDFIRFAKSKNIPVGPGRGSAAGSLVSYAMEITDIDPLEYGLLFERFLNPERVSMPDIDIDFCTKGRGEVIHYVTEKYGRERVAQIITFGTLAAKAAIKDVGRVLDMSVRRCRPHLKAGPQAARHQAEGRHRRSATQRGSVEGCPRQRSSRRQPEARRAGAQRRYARGRGRHLLCPAARTGSALRHQQARNCHPVRHGGPRKTRPAEDGLPGAHHAHHHSGRAGADQEVPRRDRGGGRPAARRPGDLREDLLQRLHQRRVPV